MMLGHVDPQGSLLEPGLLFGDLVTRGSFHDKLAACVHELISDDDFVGLYALNRGRPSIPPSLMMRGMLLAVKDDTSDRESARRSRVDLDWKHALGVPCDFPGIGATTFSLFRSRVVLHRADQVLFRKTVRKAVEARLFPRKILALLDSPPAPGRWSSPAWSLPPTSCSRPSRTGRTPRRRRSSWPPSWPRTSRSTPTPASPASARVWRRTASCRPPIPRCATAASPPPGASTATSCTSSRRSPPRSSWASTSGRATAPTASRPHLWWRRSP